MNKHRGDCEQHAEGLKLGEAARRVRLEYLEEMLQQSQAVRAECRPPRHQVGEPGMAVHDCPSLRPEFDEVGEPVASGRPEAVLGSGGIAHEVEQILTRVQIAVQRRRAGAKACRNAAH